MTVYVDVLFLVNFCMDLVSLYGAGALLHRKRAPMRLVLSAALGAGYGVLEVLTHPGGWSGTVLLLVASLGMCLIAYGPHGYFSTYVVFVGAEAFLGGIMSLLYTAASKLFQGALPESAQKRVTFPGFVLALSVSLMVGALTRRTLNRFEGGIAQVSATVGGCRLRFSAICDSGNFLADPLTDTPVILIGEGTPGAGWLSAYENPKGYRMIPYESVGGRGMLVAHKPEALTVEYGGKTYCPRALVAVSRGTASFDGRGGCVPVSLLRG